MNDDDRQTKSHGGGIYSRWSGRYDERRYFVPYRWTPKTDDQARLVGGTKGKPKKITETVDPDGDGRVRLESAKRLKALRDRQRRLPDWSPPHIAEQLEAARKLAETEQRAPLQFEAARDRYIDDLERVGRTARSITQARGHLRTLERFFGGKMLDEVTVADTRRFFLARLKQEHPFGKDWHKKPVGKRAPEADLTTFRTLYAWLRRAEARTLTNPCERPAEAGEGSLLAPYTPKREKVIPDSNQLVAIFTATKRAKTGWHATPGRELIRNEHRVLWALCYYTAARPESEPCRLRHGDVRFLDDDWGEITYRFGKNRHSYRTLPVPPTCATALRGIMLDAPDDNVVRRPMFRVLDDPNHEKDLYETWADTPIFARPSDRMRPWGPSSYRAAWLNLLTVVPGIEGMVVRDLRSTANTVLRKGGIATNVRQAFLGHSTRTMEGRYDHIDAADLRAAAEVLERPLENLRLADPLADHQESS